jgi:hypothetical protein
MRTLLLFALTTAASVMWAGCDGPDLVVTDIEALGAPTINADNSVEQDIRVVVRNQGTASADIFKVSTEYTSASGTFAVAFTVPGENDIWYPYTDASLGVDEEVTFEGTLTFNPSVHGVTVSVVAIADSCSGDEFMPDYCRVSERNEANNRSSSISIALP